MYLFYGDACIAAVIAVISTLLFLVSKYLARNDDYWEKRGVPFAPRYSLWEALKIMREKPVNEILLETRRKRGKTYGGFEFSKPLVVVGEPNLLRDILVKDFNVFSYRREIKMGDSMLDNMVSVMKGDDWKRVRTIITPAFTSKRMRAMGSIINDCSKTVIETFHKHFQKDEPVDCRSIFGAFTMDVIASSAFATKIESINDPKNVFVQKAKESSISFSAWRMILFLLLPTKVITYFRLSTFGVMDFFKSVIQKVIKERRQSLQRFNDVLQILMDALEENRSGDVINEHQDLLQDEADQYGTVISEKDASPNKYKSLSEDELIAQCVLFFMVGYETSASALSYLSYCLAVHPEWQEKLIQEVDKAFANYKEMSYDSVREMKVLDAILSEILRMFPPLMLSERTCTEDYRLGETGILIEKGMVVNFPIYSMHYDPEYFDDPHTFNPERFMTSDPRHPPYAYLPFGAGPRNCLGMRFALLEIKLCVANILRHYRFRRAPETKVPLEFKKGIGFLSVTKLPLALEKRTDVGNGMSSL